MINHNRNMNDLLKRTKIDFAHKAPRNVSRVLPRMKAEGELAKKSGDNEKAFIMLKRWLNIVEWIKTTKAYKEDSQYYITQCSIDKEPEVRALFAILEKTLIDLCTPEKPEPEVKEVSNGESRVNHSPMEGVLDLPETPTDEPIGKESDDFMSCLQLYQFMKPQYRPLIIDIRTKEEYEESRIKSDRCINIPANQISKGILAASFEKLFSHDKVARDLFEHRGANYIDILVILDWNTTSATLFPDNRIRILMDILKLWDPGTKPAKITVLDGGFAEWLNCYPSCVTNPNVKAPDAQTDAMDEIFEYTGVEYPDFRTLDERSSPFNALRIDTSKNSGSKKNNADQTIDEILINRKGKNTSLTPKDSLLNRNVQKYPSSSITYVNDSTDTIMNPYKSVNKKISELSRREHKPDYRDTENMNVEEDESIFDSVKFPNKPTLSNVPKPRIDRSSKPSNLIVDSYADCKALLTLKNQLYNLLKNQESYENEILSIEAEFNVQDVNDNRDTSEAKRVHNLSLKERLNDLKDTLMKLIDKKAQVKEALLEQTILLQNESLNPSDKRERSNLDLKIGSVEQRIKLIHMQRKTLRQDREKEKTSILIPKQSENGISKEPLKSDGSSANTGLKRSYSSPNLLKQVDDGKIPLVDRSSKPQTTIRQATNKGTIVTGPRLTWKDRVQRMDPVYRTTRPGITGLKNLGNSCYMNSIIQCLSNNIRLAKYFNEDAYLDDLNRSVNNCKQGQVADEVAHVIKALWRGQYKSISPHDLKVVVGQYRRQFCHNEQQDSHEFLVFLLDWLHNDLKKEDDRYLDGLSVPRRQWFKEIGNGESIISELFIGQSKSSIICSTCGNSSFTYETFNSLTLSLPHTNRCTLDDCVKKYVTGQKVSDWKCDNCEALRDATKKFDFIKLPPTVVIHLNRFADSMGGLQKSNTSVDFPLSDFDLASYLVDDVDSKNTQSLYDLHKMSLYAVSVHSGTMDGGHYMAYCRNVGQHKWYRYDDQIVTEVPPSEVKNQGSNSYLLFYTTIENEAYPYIRGPTMKLGRL